MESELRLDWPPSSASSQANQLRELSRLLERAGAPDELIIRVQQPAQFPDEDTDEWQLPSSLQLIVDELARRERRHLRSLTLADFGIAFTESEDWQPLGDLNELWPKLPALERLVLQGESMMLGTLDLPEVRDVAVRGTLRQGELASIAAARWPQIERLEILSRSSRLSTCLFASSPMRLRIGCTHSATGSRICVPCDWETVSSIGFTTSREENAVVARLT